jgi:uncharacterized protein
MTNMSHPPILRRRVNIAFDPAKAKGWHLTNKEIEDFLNAISYVFPPGEKFFIQSVQNYQDRITDPVLKDQVKRFIYQEAMHTKEHARCNDVLNTAYPYGHEIEEFTAKMLALNSRVLPKSWQLASTCALEHFTAILADGLLCTQEKFIAESDAAFASLWLWHAVEEAEHKAVCFDVYQHICGKGVFSYLRRAGAMVVITISFLITVLVAGRAVRKTDKQSPQGAAPKPADGTVPKHSAWHALKEVVSPKLYFDYYRPSFQPWDHDNVDRIEEWKERYKYFGAGLDVPFADKAGDESHAPA